MLLNTQFYVVHILYAQCVIPLQCYSMRNGILGLMGEIVVKVLCREDLDDTAKKLRDQLLDKMEVIISKREIYYDLKQNCSV